jgi:hypothetical chaperone protein
MPATLALDFGTSNSAAAMLLDGQVRRLPIETGSDTLPTAVFFPVGGGPMLIGARAITALIDGEDGRFMRAMKSVLGTRLFHESRLIAGKRRTLAGIVTAFLQTIKARAEAEAGLRFDRLLCGRPVHFHSTDAARDQQAEADLRACCLAAGFVDVTFRFEPEGAALATHAQGAADEVGIILDIGGGTSDFSVYERRGGRLNILASHGIRLGGTDFDKALSMTHAMPWLGLGSQLRREMGPGLLPMPRHLYLDLSTWAKIPFLYNAETRAEVAAMVKLAVKPRLVGRLATVLQHELGHDIAFAVEAGKIAANGEEAAKINLTRIEAGLAPTITEASMDKVLSRYRAPLEEAALETCRMAGVAPEAIGAAVHVGGSSLMRIVGQVAQGLFPKAIARQAEPFTAVVDGLALATGLA